MVLERWEIALEPLLVPAGVSLRSEKHRALVVIDAVDLASHLGEVGADLAADEPGGACDKNQVTD